MVPGHTYSLPTPSWRGHSPSHFGATIIEWYLDPTPSRRGHSPSQCCTPIIEWYLDMVLPTPLREAYLGISLVSQPLLGAATLWRYTSGFLTQGLGEPPLSVLHY